MSEEIQTIVVSARGIARVATFVSKEPTRYYLNGVSIEAHDTAGALLVTTDGHRMGVLHDRDAIVPGGLKVVLCRSSRTFAAARTARDTMNLKPWVVIRTATGGTGSAVLVFAATATEAIGEMDFPVVGDRVGLVDGRFPDWRRVIPRPEDIAETIAVSIKARYVADFEASAATRSKEGAPIRIFAGKDHTGPLLVRLVDRESDDFLGVVMPMQASNVSSHPEWLTLPKKETRLATAAE